MIQQFLFIIFLLNSDGGGRSGVFCAIDANMELSEEEDAFQVFGYLKKLRQSRKGLIENVVSLNNFLINKLNFILKPFLRTNTNLYMTP